MDVAATEFLVRIDEEVLGKMDDSDKILEGKRGFDDMEDGTKPGGTDVGIFTKPGGVCGREGVKWVGTKAFAVARISPSGLDS